MKYIFVFLLTFPVSMLAQSSNDSLKVNGRHHSDRPRHIYFSELSRLKKLYPTYRVISNIKLPLADTTLFVLYIFERKIYCLSNDILNESIKGIDGSVKFTLCNFQDVRLEDKVFKGNTEFRFCGFDSSSEFYRTRFDNDVCFDNSTFQNSHVFNHCQFKKNVTFDRVVSIQNFVFKAVEFQESSFRGANFSRGLSFYETVFNGVPDFIDIQLPHNLVFSDVSFRYNQLADQKEKIDFSNSKLDSLRSYVGYPTKCMFQASRTDISRFILPYDRFLLVFFDGTTYEEKISAYEAIINSCREAGLKESVEGWDIEYRTLQNRQKFGYFGLFINVFNKYWWNFGYDKWLILIFWLPFFFSCFLVYNLCYIERLWRNMYQDNELGKGFNKRSTYTAPPRKLGGEKFAFVFFYTAIIYFGFKIRHEAVNYKNTRGILYLYLMYTVGTVHVAFAFGYIINAY